MPRRPARCCQDGGAALPTREAQPKFRILSDAVALLHSQGNVSRSDPPLAHGGQRESSVPLAAAKADSDDETCTPGGMSRRSGYDLTGDIVAEEEAESSDTDDENHELDCICSHFLLQRDCEFVMDTLAIFPGANFRELCDALPMDKVQVDKAVRAMFFCGNVDISTDGSLAVSSGFYHAEHGTLPGLQGADAEKEWVCDRGSDGERCAVAGRTADARNHTAAESAGMAHIPDALGDGSYAEAIHEKGESRVLTETVQVDDAMKERKEETASPQGKGQNDACEKIAEPGGTATATSDATAPEEASLPVNYKQLAPVERRLSGGADEGKGSNEARTAQPADIDPEPPCSFAGRKVFTSLRNAKGAWRGPST